MESKRWGKFKVVFGKRLKTRGKNPICPMCEKAVLPGQHGIYVRSLGEYGREFHIECMGEFAVWILMVEKPCHMLIDKQEFLMRKIRELSAEKTEMVEGI